MLLEQLVGERLWHHPCNLFNNKAGRQETPSEVEILGPGP